MARLSRLPLRISGCVASAAEEGGSLILAVEGIDAAGKATQTKALVEAIKSRGGDARRFDFPRYEGIAGGLVGRILRGDVIVAPAEEIDREGREQCRDAAHWGDWDGWTLGSNLAKSWTLDKGYVIQSVMLADRYEHYPMLRQAELSDVEWLVLDRYTMSGIVYGQVDGLDRNWLVQVHEPLPTADLYVLLDITVEESMRRRPERRDYYEKNTEKLEKIRALYLQEFAAGVVTNSTGLGHRFRVIDGTLPPEEITQQILSWM
jgi:thymidylate kinase